MPRYALTSRFAARILPPASTGEYHGALLSSRVRSSTTSRRSGCEPHSSASSSPWSSSAGESGGEGEGCALREMWQMGAYAGWLRPGPWSSSAGESGGEGSSR